MLDGAEVEISLIEQRSTLDSNKDNSLLVSLSLEDESQDTIDGSSRLTVLTPVNADPDYSGRIVNYDKEIEKQFSYLQRTRDLELSSERVKFLQDIADKMSGLLGIQSRVVIQRKSRSPEAFVYPDGTIFINQTALNALDSVDEVAGVIAHELGHVKNGTTLASLKSGDHLGVGWLHEAAGDSMSPDLLEAIGYNSNGFREAIKKISPENSRDDVHRSSLSRASQDVGIHSGRHFETSSTRHTPLPRMLKTTEIAPPTNGEILSQIFKEENQIALQDALKKLHPKDLKEEYSKLAHLTYRSAQNEQKIREMIRVYHDHLRGRLIDHGVQKTEQDYFFLCLQQEVVGGIVDYSMIRTPEETLEVVNNAADYHRAGKFAQMSTFLFDEDIVPGEIRRVTRVISRDLNDVKKDINPNGIPLTQETLLVMLHSFQDMPEDFWEKDWHGGSTKDSDIAALVHAYTLHAFGEKRENDWDWDKSLNEDDAREFLTRIKHEGINLLVRQDEDFPIRDNKKQFYKLYKEIFKEKPNMLQEIDLFINETTQDAFVYSRAHAFSRFLEKIHAIYKDDEISPEDRLKHLTYISDQIDNIVIPDNQKQSETLKIQAPEGVDPVKFEQDLVKFNYKLVSGLTLFENDSDEFYTYMEDLMNNSPIPYQDLSIDELTLLSRDLIRVQSGYNCSFWGGNFEPIGINFDKKVRINNFKRFIELPYLNTVINGLKEKDLDTFDEINHELYKVRRISGNFNSVYGTNMEVLLFGQNVRRSFLDLLYQGITPEDLPELDKYIFDTLPDGPQKGLLLREVSMHMIQRDDLSLEQRVAYLKNNFKRLGVEGLTIVADRIATLTEYRWFKEEMNDMINDYLSGKNSVSDLALADNLTSKIIRQQDGILDTCNEDPEARKSTSTKLAKEWLHTTFYSDRVRYDPNTRRVILDNLSSRAFKTFADWAELLHNLTPSQRLLIAHKSLVDPNGALSTHESRQKLGKTLVSSLDLNSSFLRQAVELGCEVASPDFFSFPAAQMIGPLLFRSISSGDVQFRELRPPNDDMNESDVARVISSTTQEVTEYGDQFTPDGDSLLDKLSVKSREDYAETIDFLKALLLKEEQVKQSRDTEIDPSTEAVIRAAEGSGALGVRSLQLARQLYSFSPAIDRRLSNSFDARPGLNKLLFWENLDRLAKRNNGVYRAFIENELVSVDNFLGGGSLNTTYKATVKREDGTTQDIALKMKNPNPEMFIEETYRTANTVLSRIEEDGTEKDKRLAQMGKIFIELSYHWCLRDISDTTFTQDDDEFRGIADSFNENKDGDNQFYVPERVFDSETLQAEELASGQTLNQLLNDDTVPPGVKKEAVGRIFEFYQHQLTQVSDEKGYILVHSDPHIGNYVVDRVDNELVINVIDRSMYLRLSDEEAKMFGNLLQSGDYRKFIDPFIDHIMEINNVSNEGRKTEKDTIKRALYHEYAKEIAKKIRRPTQGMDNFALLRRLLAEFDQREYSVPLEHRLMIRNIEAFRELKDRYS